MQNIIYGERSQTALLLQSSIAADYLSTLDATIRGEFSVALMVTVFNIEIRVSSQRTDAFAHLEPPT